MPSDEATEPPIGRCEHDDCREPADCWCTCLCGRMLCAAHEFEERRAWQVRQGLAMIRHRLGDETPRSLMNREP